MSVERALAHPFRRQLLELFGERGDFSPTQAAKELDQRLGVVSYHVRVLAQAGLLELAGTTFVRGAVQHHYRARDVGLVSETLTLEPGRAKRLLEQMRALLDEARADGAAEDGVELTAVVHRVETA